MSAIIKITAVIYIFILSGIIVLADLRETQFLFAFVNKISFGDKIGHFCLMGMFSLVVNLSLGAKTIRVWKLNFLVGSAVVLLIVAAEEFSHLFVRGRTFDPGDTVADAAGIFVFGQLARFLNSKNFKFQTSRQ